MPTRNSACTSSAGRSGNEIGLARRPDHRSRLACVSCRRFGEGIVIWDDRLIELTWKSHIGFVYDLATLRPRSNFHYAGEGWALTQDGHRLIISDGTSDLRF